MKVKIKGNLYPGVKGDVTPGYKLGGRASLKLKSPYYKPKSAKVSHVRIKRRV